MTLNSPRARNRQLIRRVVLTIGIVCGTCSTIFLVSGTLRAIEQVDRVNNALAELSTYIADGHAWIRERMTTVGSPDVAAVARFDTGVQRRVAQFRSLKTLLEQQTSASVWTLPLRENIDVGRFEAERRAYLSAASATATVPVGGRVMNLRMFDLHAQKLIQTVEAVRDSADSARARALIAADGIIALSSTLGLLLIACVVWDPVFPALARRKGLLSDSAHA